jgi:predicted nucleotidyltransferase
LIDQCRWPPLGPIHAAALRATVEYALAQTSPLGVIATGTIVRGQPHATSDIDLYVVHAEPYRRRVQRFFEGVAAEIFINPPHTVRAYFAEEHASGRRITAHMLATGFVVLDLDSVVEQLRAEARDWLNRPDDFDAASAERARYGAATLLEDGADLTPHDPVGAALILSRSVTAMLEFWMRSHGRPIPRSKDLVAQVRSLDEFLGRLADDFVGATTATERLEIANSIGDRTIATRGFFEWDSGPEPVEPSQDH